MKRTSINKKKSIILLFLIIFIIVFAVFKVATIYRMQHSPNNVSSVIDQAPSSYLPIISESNSEKTYYSAVEKSCFTYPTNWQQVEPAIKPQLPESDVFSIQSPRAKVILNWNSLADGVGGYCDPKVPLGQQYGCPEVTVLGTLPLNNTPKYVVQWGILTSDSKVYVPWLALINSPGIKSERAIAWGLFEAQHNGQINNGWNTTAYFNTGGIHLSAQYLRDLSMNQKDARAYFQDPEVKEAIQILSSYSYDCKDVK